ncbi:DinB superfamily protein [Oceanobacillus limi]|uniref:DinB superfamily protein n=1 Tax=Oceanobacillus limi TaxID=930131 RepID=A0A1I0CHM4_9BACI|nr:DinB family protein [Oceanobacillus limi]SET19091.1 DinB superfamily protein [Oceanobacillus limi]
MNFKLNEAVEVLERTPKTLEYFLSGLSEDWLIRNEGKGTWNVFQVIEHLMEAERTNWIPRLESMLQYEENIEIPFFDRYAHIEKELNYSIESSLHEFKTKRTENLENLKHLLKNELQFERTGKHPALGDVKVRELISTWTVHDFTHIAQIVRVMAKRYSEDVGPWKEYLGILK